MSRVARRLLWTLGVVGTLVAGLLWVRAVRSPRVEVVNRGSTRLLELTVSVSGESYGLGDLGPGDGVTKSLVPHGESHVELDWRTPDQQRHHDVVECYFEGGWPSYSGRVLVEIDGANVLRSESNLRLGP